MTPVSISDIGRAIWCGLGQLTQPRRSWRGQETRLPLTLRRKYYDGPSEPLTMRPASRYRRRPLNRWSEPDVGTGFANSTFGNYAGSRTTPTPRARPRVAAGG